MLFDERGDITTALKLFEQAEREHPDRGKPEGKNAKGWGGVTWIQVLNVLLDVSGHILDANEKVSIETSLSVYSHISPVTHIARCYIMRLRSSMCVFVTALHRHKPWLNVSIATPGFFGTAL